MKNEKKAFLNVKQLRLFYAGGMYIKDVLFPSLISEIILALHGARNFIKTKNN